ncbi:alpha/beta fold hydrolase [Sulfuriflexus mobilis]|uniref:alpha/beta fold hydrolase n=1 Tax=Sulfuriflexus mobilis TaxID=1811807 RepID=UPI000F829DCA|nr:alpha/beta hydrolase [Sulfuriflexus mobilis]
MKKFLKWIGITFVSLVILSGIFLVISYSYNKYTVQQWLKDPFSRGEMIDIGTHKLYAAVKGEGSPAVILIAGGNSFSWGWWDIQDELAKTTKVLTYDRAGYGWSEVSPEPYSSKQIVTELHTLLQKLAIDPPYIVVGASMGGIYTKHFAKLYPDEISGAVFVDPSARDEKKLRDPKYQQGVLRQSKKISRNEISAKLGLFRFYADYLLRMHKVPEFQRAFGVEALSNPIQHKQFSKHFSSLYRIDGNHYLNAPTGFPNVPVKVIVQDNEVTIKYAYEVDEINKGNPEQKVRAYLKAAKERQRQNYMTLSSNSEWVLAKGSGHNIQFDRPDLVISSVNKIIRDIKNSSQDMSDGKN